MKPIKLVIKGLNSFIEEQTIDFNKLTNRGLFGIFGPTGSGKSTILDGITLALYGEIARKSSNYINVNCNDLNVSFTFQVSGTEDKIYTVTRNFRRDKNTGNAKTHAARVVEQGGEVLGEGATQVTKVCKEILGLSLEDFTRTVVLPQGKFSEFLKLEGKNKREMLERLFNLQMYGDELSQKLSAQINRTEKKKTGIEGQLKEYQDLSKEKLEERQGELQSNKEVLKENQKQLEKTEREFKEKEEVWTLKQELQEYKVKKENLDKETPAIEEMKEKVNRGESALRIAPSLLAYEKTKANIQIEKEEVITYQKVVECLGQQKEAIEKNFEEISKQREKKLPILTERSQLVEAALEQQEKVYQIEKEVENIVGQLGKLEQNLNQFELEQQKLDNKYQEESIRLEQGQKEEASYRVDEKLRSNVQRGLMLMQRIQMEKQQLEKKVATCETLSTESKQINTNIKVLKEQEAEILQKLIKEESQKLSLSTPPITQEQLMKQQERLTQLKLGYERYAVIEQERKEYKQKIEINEQQLEEVKQLCQREKQQLEQLQISLEKAKMENMVYAIRTHLHQGDACPVCGGNIELSSLNKEGQSLEIDQQEQLVKQGENRLEQQISQVNKLQIQKEGYEERYQKLTEEGEALKPLLAEGKVEEKEVELESLTQTLYHYEKQKKELDESLIYLREEKSKKGQEIGRQETLVLQNDKQRVTLEEEIKQHQQVILEHQGEANRLKEIINQTEELEDYDFGQLEQLLKEKDEKRATLEQLIIQLREEKEKTMKEREAWSQKISKYKASYQRGLAQFDSQQKQKMNGLLTIGEKLQGILIEQTSEQMEGINKSINLQAFIESHRQLKTQLNGEKSYVSVLQESEEVQSITSLLMQYPLLGDLLEQLGQVIKGLKVQLNEESQQLEESFCQLEQSQKQIAEQYQQQASHLLTVKVKLEQLEKRAQEENKILEQALKEENLIVEEVKAYLLTKEQINTFKEAIEQHQKMYAQIEGTITQIALKLKGRNVEENEWVTIKEQLAEKKLVVESQKEKCIQLEVIVNKMMEQLHQLQELLQEKEKVEHKMAILKDLDKLFKGKRFVEYVAISRLKYIARQASARLQEISCNNYGLEVDESGKFIIRDYKNGGRMRDASTLSGGETFLASLALALALSAEIQLKATAPLELFFLDEGFGTLDDELLEVVMGSLERIHHDKLKIGIISHVESIKNRVPVKLLLTPAEAGVGGTKVRMEVS